MYIYIHGYILYNIYIYIARLGRLARHEDPGTSRVASAPSSLDLNPEVMGDPPSFNGGTMGYPNSWIDWIDLDSLYDLYVIYM